MSSRRNVLADLRPGPTTHAGLWLDKGLANVDGAGGHRQEHFEGLTQSIKIPGTYRAFFARWREQVAQVPPCTILAEARVKGRMIVGLGAESILETGITLNHTYGVPYLPGSSLKGLATSFAHKMLEDADWRKGTGASHRVLFGDQESSGYVTFHDALWIPESADQLPFDLDVMTVHHPKYYQGEPIAPSGIESPNPVAFLTTRGSFLLAVSGPKVWATAALDILQDALHEEGLGAKTAAGYGRMDLLDRPRRTSSATQSTTADLWHPADIRYDAGKGELTAVLPGQPNATALQKETKELLETLDPNLRAVLQKKRQAKAEVQVGLEGIRPRIMGLRPVSTEDTKT
ncbi:MAG TPA: type III-B CRISPR module RAMP protein Cmr6 [Thermoanaerobaculia bacterium]|nr:type III-B CRISPR module RAMP protein Cmr6 [Thermoanaerobaculia bacterium]